MDQVKAKMQALRAAADAATEKNEQLEKQVKDLQAQLAAVCPVGLCISWASFLHTRLTMSWPTSSERSK
jgi:hypothetical protein